MPVLKVGTVGWKKLQKILDTLIQAIDANAPVQGDGISISYTASGAIISLSSKPDDGGTGGGGGGGTTGDGGGANSTPPSGGTADWQPMTVMDSNCTPKTIYYWGTPPT